MEQPSDSCAFTQNAEHEVEGLSDESPAAEGAEAEDVWSPPEVHDMGSAFDSLNLSAVPRGVPSRIEDILNGRHNSAAGAHPLRMLQPAWMQRMPDSAELPHAHSSYWQVAHEAC
jgi:hypothetical protein